MKKDKWNPLNLTQFNKNLWIGESWTIIYTSTKNQLSRSAFDLVGMKTQQHGKMKDTKNAQQMNILIWEKAFWWHRTSSCWHFKGASWSRHPIFQGYHVNCTFWSYWVGVFSFSLNCLWFRTELYFSVNKFNSMIQMIYTCWKWLGFSKKSVYISSMRVETWKIIFWITKFKQPSKI